ncbi:MAG: YnfA family protein [Nitrospira sp.]|uniref:Uncharacterized protein n=1 Tax=Nitrospira defluvii TaxID=330214 RepID=A0ABN7LR24_9BACT|nr:YnfA family protein [Nitrospira defluvii]MCS6329308.1 YnfA family protein [Nitrospira sp.]CAE6765203.1 conserved membrane hypothetical protein [Nitrospira defluvii]
MHTEGCTVSTKLASSSENDSKISFFPDVRNSYSQRRLAGLFEIGGGYLIWQWWRNGSHWSIGLLGAVVLILYGIVPTYQPSHFGRVYAAYGGWFIILSILWGWLVDHVEPDRFDVIGAMVCLVGVTVMMYWPR